MKILRIRVVEPFHLGMSPVYPSSIIGRSYVSGIPLPSTIVGALGVSLGLRLDRGDVSKDPLLGLSILAKKFAELGFREPAILGPVALIDGIATLPVTVKNVTKFVDAKCVLKVESLRKLHEECFSNPVAYVAVLTRIGIALDPYKRVVRKGYTFRTAFSYVIGSDGEARRFELLYMLNVDSLDLKDTVVRFGGEDRIAKIETLDLKDLDRDLESIIHLIESPLNLHGDGYFLTLSYWPLIPKRDELYLDRESFLGLELIDIEFLHRAPPRVELLGLGFSEVAKKRRPLIPVFPPGTVLKLKHLQSSETPSVLRTLWSLGYGSLLRLPRLWEP